ncbi:MAG TPA: cytochrome c oxidase assembly protein [Chloroflexota bacterium]|jgi:cytochrome c oxidase assembly factor CtaG|nr:cytochrome c oxidase assembly protein [Chloroflexota bacterium]
MTASPSFGTVLTMWSFQPTVILGLALLAGIYIAGLRELQRRGRYGTLVRQQHVVYFALALCTIFLALESPIDVLSNQLFSVHMLQHVMLLSIAPPLLLLGKPIPVLLVGAPHPVVRRVARAHARQRWFHGLTAVLTTPIVAWLAFSVVLVWHAPAFYQAALRSDGVHLFEHVCYLAAGMLFWWVVIEPLPGPPRLAYVWRILYLVSAMLPGTLLGVFFAINSTPVYPFYAALPRLWGIPALTDQGWAGVIMMMLGDSILVIAAAPLLAALIARLDASEFARAAALEAAQQQEDARAMSFDEATAAHRTGA